MTWRGRALALTAAVSLLPATAAAADGGHWRGHHLPWHRSVVVHHDRIVRMHVTLGGGDAVVRRAKVRQTPHTVRIGLSRRTWTGASNAIAYQACVQVHLRFRVRNRHRVDSSTDVARDRGEGGTVMTRWMRGHRRCTPLRAKYLPAWRYHEHWREER